jgi:hypothetical protein
MVMRISIKKTGGYAGELEIVNLDTSQLDPDVARQVEQRIHSSGFFNYSTDPGGSSIGSDYEKYEITVSEGSRQHTVMFTDDKTTATELLSKLVESLRELG